MLRVDDLHTSYGNIRALKGISFEVPAGHIVTLLGANGAGKTTTLRTLSGLLSPARGAIWFGGRRIDHLAPEKIVALGISHVPEGRKIFGEMTVLENLQMGAFLRRDRKGVQTDLERVYALFPVLRERRHQMAQTLSGGEQQMLTIGRALMARPRLLLLDEPSLGLAPILVEEIFKIIEEINAHGTTILLVEQNSQIALSTSRYAYILETGRITLEGKSAALLDNEQVRKAYLG